MDFFRPGWREWGPSHPIFLFFLSEKVTFPFGIGKKKEIGGRPSPDHRNLAGTNREKRLLT